MPNRLSVSRKVSVMSDTAHSMHVKTHMQNLSWTCSKLLYNIAQPKGVFCLGGPKVVCSAHYQAAVTTVTWSCMVKRSHSHKVTWSQGHMVTRSHGRRVTWSQGHKHEQFQQVLTRQHACGSLTECPVPHCTADTAWVQNNVMHSCCEHTASYTCLLQGLQ